jgi:hypothetical protein
MPGPQAAFSLEGRRKNEECRNDAEAAVKAITDQILSQMK